ncbi:Ig-like domain-containing protein [Nostoc sp. FACHB-145]|uniref:Ig-like domain-containing protein n=1 Tax=Nostoc sp. FACHB-145 TaxID=2692836 RepID=UPI001683C4A5|nr:Ig-like domain-containing protein [Nostoc sp. FACHB-145]MBD2468818.1 cadherin domain-containing protein [Nostoc sp. FACHB-145]
MGSKDNLGNNNAGNNDGLMPPSLLESASLEDNSALIELQKALQNSISFDPVSLVSQPDTKSKTSDINNVNSNQNTAINYIPPVSSIFNSGQTLIPDITSSNIPTNNQQDNQNIDPITGEPTYQASSPTVVSSIPNFAIRSEGTITINGNSDLDGVPQDSSDDALIYANKGFIINGNSILPVQRDAAGNPIKDASGKLILVDKAVAVSSGYTVANGPSNKYANLVPPQLVEKQVISVPAYADIKQIELARRIPSGTPTVTFNVSQNPINNANEWAKKFPASGTASTPTVVKVTGGGLTIPSNVTLNNYVIIVEQGDISFNGSNHNFNNVALITNNGNINLSNVQAKELAVFASGSINMNGGAKFAGTTLLANSSNNGSIIFNGATSSINTTDNLRVISQGDITYNGASNTRGSFLSVKNFTYNGNSTLYGTIGAKGNIIFNGVATVIHPDTIAPVVTASLVRDTAPGSTTNTDKITFDPTIIARVTDNSPIVELRAGFNDTAPANYKSFQPQYNADGSFTISRTQLETIYGSTLNDGIHTLHLQAVDLYGNLSNIYNLTFNLDTKTLTPTNLDLATSSDSGISNTDNITNKTQPTITGNAEAGAVVKLSNNGQVIGTGVTSSSGVWQIVTSNLTDGTYNLTASAEDIAGNVSSVSTPLPLVVDTVAPNAPTLKLATSSDTGISNSDKITKNSTPLIGGNAASNSIVRLYKQGQLIGQTTATANGTWELQTQSLADGQHIFTATAEDVAGNKSPVSSQLTITVDTQIAPPNNLDLVASSDSGISNSDNITQDSTPTISGNAEASSIVQLFRNGQLLGQTTVDGNGNWQFTTNTLADGSYNVTAVASDIAGNVSTNSTPVSFIIDTVLPQLTLTTPSVTQPLTQSSRLVGTVDGTGSAVVALGYQFDQLPQITVPLDARSTFDQAFDLTGIANGQHILTITTTDLAGNITKAQYDVIVAVDNEAPIINATLQRDTAPGNTTNSDLITFDPSVKGIVSDANSVVSFRAGFDNTDIANFVNVLPQRQADGSFSFNRTQLESIYGSALPDGQHVLKLQAVDSYGNSSNIFALAFTLDTITPAPTLELSTASDSGFSNSDRLTNHATPTITGTAEAGASVQLFSDTQQIGQTTVNSDGTWQIIASQLTDGIHHLSASVIDIAGNTNSAITALDVNIDTALPQLTLDIPVNQAPLRSGNKLIGSINGTGSSITSLSYRFNTQQEIAIAHNGAGAFDQELDLTGLGNGIHLLTIVAIDAAGNRLTTQYNVTVQLDETAPIITAALANDTAPGGTTNSDLISFDPTISGSIVDISRVAQFKAGFNNTPITNFIDVLAQLKTDGTFSFDKSQLTAIYGSAIPDGVHTLHLLAEDEFGNLAEVYNFTFTLDTTTPTPSNLDLSANQDTGASNSDNITKYSSSTITGNAEAKASIQLVNSANGQILGQTTADTNGIWQITTNNLADGIYSLNAIATDIAGNVSNVSAITITIDSTAPILTLTTGIDNATLKAGARLEGSINGTGSAIATASYSFDNQTPIPLFLNIDGSFNQLLDFTGLSNGIHSLTILTSDIAGNITTQQYNVTVERDTTAPTITASLVRDTAPGGISNQDRITFDPTIVGSVSDTNSIIEFRAGLNDTDIANFVDITLQIQSDSSFKLTRTQLETILGSTLTDGVHTLRLVAKDEFNNISPVFEYTFTLDTTTPAPSNLDLTPDSDKGISNSDNITNVSNPTITGYSEAGATVQLINSGQIFGTATADSTGTWQIVTNELTDGTYDFTALATDIAGNVSNEAIPLQVIIDRVVPQLILTTPVNNTPLDAEAKLTGIVSGTGTAIASFSYHFDNQTEVQINFNATGEFDQQLDVTGLSSGGHVLTLIASDTAGNIKTITYNVTINNDTDAPVIVASLSNDTAPGGTTNNDKITADSAITGSVTDVSRVAIFRAGFNNTQAANFIDVTAQLSSDGNFSFNRTQLEAIYGGTLPDGTHTLRLIATDEFGNQSNAFSFTFTLDTNIAQPVFDLDVTSDSGTVGDKKTNFETVTLTGLTQPGATVVLTTTSRSVIADHTGKFTFTNVSLLAGENSFNVQATDIAGNQSTYIANIYRFSPPSAVNLSATSIPENSANGTIIGQLNSIDPDTGDRHTYTLIDDAQGRFKIVGNSLQVANSKLLNYENNSQHIIIVRSTDAGGLSATQEFTIFVTNVNEAPSFTSTPTNTTVESGSTYTYNITTTDPDTGDRRTITATEIPSWLTLIDNGDGTATLTGTPNENQLGLFNLAFKVQDEGGLSHTQNIIISSQISLSEGTYFTAIRDLPLIIPAEASFLTFKIDPSFDTTTPNAINDAFEVALVDINGKSLVSTIAPLRDAFFNLTEGENVALGSGTSYNASDRTVRLNLTGIQPGNARLLFRLVNNDGDTTTNVSITQFALQTAPEGTQASLPSAGIITPTSSTTVNFNNLTDVSQSLNAEYHRTSFNADKHLLYADIAVHNIGSYSVDAPLIVAVKNISNPSVIIRNPDGFTPEGLPYYNFSFLVGDGKLDSGESTQERSLVFYNPQGVQFNYELVVLAQLNSAPIIQTQAKTEITGGQSYSYQVKAIDPNSDSLIYRLMVAPDGMTIDAATGLINWNTTTSNIGNHTVVVEVSDSRGGITQQTYTLSVIETPPNRPPIFTSTPVVDAAINTPYYYDANATDLDRDNLNYSLKLGPEGMTIDPTTGEVRWTPTQVTMFGDTVLGRINNPGEQNAFTFSMVAGERIYFDPLKYTGSPNNWKVQIISPSGNLILNSDYNFSGLLTLHETGNYRLVIDPNADITGEYGFSLINIDATPIAAMDSNISGVLSPGSEDDVYRFTGKAGARLYFDNLVDTSQLDFSPGLDWRIYAPNNSIISSNNWNDMEVILPVDGEYIVALRGNRSFNDTVPYAFRIITSDTNTTSLILGNNDNPRIVNNGILEKGEQDIYTFVGRPGQRLSLDTITSNGTNIAYLESPSGFRIFERDLNNGNLSPFTLTEAGTYRLVIDGLGQSTGTYSFSMVDVSSATSINLDTNVSNRLNPGQQTHFYQFSAASGQRLYLDSLTNVPNTSWDLIDSSNQILATSSMSYDQEVTLNNSGTYLLAIYGFNNSPVDYAFRVITPETQIGTFAIGNTIAGEIAEKGEQDVYTFTGIAGQQLFYDALGGDYLNFRLYNPAGNEIYSADSRNDRGPNDGLTLTTNGTYRVVIDGNGADTGSYKFHFLNKDAATNVALDTNITGAFSSDGWESQLYRFTLTSDRYIYFDSQTLDSSNNWLLYGPGGQYITSHRLHEDHEQQLTAGEYLLVMQGNGAGNANYQMRLVTPELNTNPITASVINSTISEAGEQDTYTFTGSAGISLYFDSISGNSNIIAKLVSPGGQEVWSGSTDTDSALITLLEAGSYRLTIDGNADSTGNYNFQLFNANTASSLTSDTATSGSLTAKSTKLYTINGTAGQKLKFDSLQATANADWVLYAPGTLANGSVILGAEYLSNDFEVFLPTSGTYVLALRSAASSTVNYSFQVSSLSSPTGTNSDFGIVRSGNVTSVQPVNHTFTAKAGTLVYFDSQIQSSFFYGVTATVLDSNNNIVDQFNASYDRGLIQLQNSGTYTIRLSGNGSYGYQIVDLATSANLGLNTITNVTLNPGNKIQVYKFTGSVGQQLFYDGIDSNSTSASVRFFSPSGSEIFNINARSDRGVDSGLTLKEAGTYYLIFSGNQEAATNINFRLLDKANATTIGLDTDIAGTFVNSRFETNLYRFQGTTGQYIYFDFKSGSFPNTWVLYGAGGQKITSRYLSEDSEFALPGTGEYLLAIGGNNSENPNYTFRLATPIFSNTALNLNQIVNGSISKPGENDTYTFSGTVGQQLFFDALNTNNPNLTVRLFTPSGRQLYNGPVQNDRGPNTINGIFTGFTLTEAGNYQLVIDGNGDSQTNYSFRLLDKAAATYINLDTDVTGSFTDSSIQSNVYRFNGQAGQYIYLDTGTGQFPNAWILYGPDGQSLNAGYVQDGFYDDYGLSLPATGEYFFVVQGNGATNQNYKFHIAAPQLNTKSLTLNQTTSGSLSKLGQNDTYTFSGTAGQQLYFDALNINNPNFTVRFYTPNGKELYSGPVQNNRGSETINNYGVIFPGLILAETGTYRLVIDGNRDAVGDYSFRLLNKADATTINLNTDITDSFVAGGRETVLYRFIGTADQHIYIDYSDAGSGNSWILYGTGGQRLDSGSLTTDCELTLPFTGEYLLALANNGDPNPNYKLHLATSDLTTPPTALILGETVNGHLSQRGENDIYTFNGTFGQKLYFDALNTNNPNFTVRFYAPSGKEIYTGPVNQDRGSEPRFGDYYVLIPGLILNETGTYQLVIDGNGAATGDYSFRIFDNSSATPLTFNTTVTGSASDSGKGSDAYRFTGNAGQYLYFDSTSSNSANRWLLYGVDGELISSWNLQEDYELALPNTGDYLLVMQGNGDSSANYQLQVIAPQLRTSDLTLGQKVNGNIAVRGQKDTDTFTGSAGQKYFFDALNTTNPNLTVQLFTPNGRELYSGPIKNDRGSDSYSNVYGTYYGFELPEAGTYRLVIDGNADATGSYSFRLSAMADAPTLVMSTPTAGSLDPGNEVDLYRIAGTIGQKLHFDLEQTAFTGANWLLYGTNGQVIAAPGASFSDSSDFNVMLPATGLYTLAIIGNSTDPVNYNFTVTDQTPTAVPTTGLGILQSGTIAAGQVADYTFTAASGTRIYFDSLDADNDEVQVTLFNPDGTPVFGCSASTDNYQSPIQLQQTGTYTLRVQGFYAHSTGDYQYRILELPFQNSDSKNDENSVQLGVSFGKALQNGRTAEVYSFTGAAGQQIYLDAMMPTGGLKQATLQLFAPSGERLVYDFALNYSSPINAGPYTLQESGIYNFIVSSEENGPVDYRYQILDLAAATPIEFNRRISGNLQPGSATKFYKLSGSKGQHLYFDSIAGSGANWVLYHTNSREIVANNFIGNDFEIILPKSGEYTLGLVGNSNTVSNYSFQVLAPVQKTAIITPGDGEGSNGAVDDLGTYRVRIDVSDGKGGTAEQDFRIRISPERGNHAPVINTEAIVSGYSSKRYVYDVDATDAEGDSLTYLLTNAPSGMLIDSATGKITWATPKSGTHKVNVRVEDGRGGIEVQSFDLLISDSAPATIKGTVYLDQNGDGKWTVTNPGNMTPNTHVTIGESFRDNYIAYDLGRPAGIAGTFGSMTFKHNADGSVDPNTLLLSGGADSPGGTIYEVKVLRGEGGHIIGFDDDNNPETPYYASYFADSPYSDAGLVYTPDNVLLANMWSASGINIINPGGAPKQTLPYRFGGLAFVPEGLPGAGQLKATGHWPSNAFYTLNYSTSGTFADGTPKYVINSADYETNVGFGPGAFVYMGQTAPDFEDGAGILVADWNTGQINAYDIDSDGNPIASTQKLFMGDFGGAWGATKDPVTGDVIFTPWVRPWYGNPGLTIVRGLGQAADNEPGAKNWIVYVDADLDGVRDADERFTYTDSRGQYSFDLAPGTYRIAQELQPGWTQTSPTNPRYWDVTVAANNTKIGIDFGVTNSKLAGDNVDPEFTSTAVTQVTTGEKYLYRATATDLNADDLTYDLVFKPEGMAIAPNGTISWRPGNEQVGKHQVIVRVRDPRGGVDLQAFEVEVMQGNRAPNFTSVAPNMVHTQTLKQFQYQAKALDLDGDSITYEIVRNTVRPVTPDNATINPTTGLVTWTPTTNQTGGAFKWGYSDQLAPWQILIRATDGRGGEAFSQLNLIVDPQAPNRIPQITSSPRNNTRLGETYLYKIVATDADNDVLTYSLVTAPAGMTLENGIISWTPTAAQFGDNQVILQVTDGGAIVEQRFKVNVGNQITNYAPVITSAPDFTTNIGRDYQYQLTATDADGDVLLWALENGPDGMIVDSNTGTLSWKPSLYQIGEHSVKVFVLDTQGAFAVQEFTLSVTGINAPPAIFSNPVTKAAPNQQYTYSVVANDPENDELTFSLGSHPAGMTIDNGVIRWTPQASQVGQQEVEVLVTDGQGAVTRQIYTIEVGSTAINHAPSITSTPVYVANVGSAYQYQVQATDPDTGDRLTYQLLSVPAGVTGISIDANTGLLTWQNPVAGNHRIVVGAVDDGGLGAAQGFSLTARVNNAPVIRSTPILTATPGSAYGYDAIAADVDGDRLMYTLDQASLNKGITLDTLGRLRWNPTVSNVGTHRIVVSVSDGITSTPQQYDLVVAADTVAPQVRLIANYDTVDLGGTVTFQARATDNIRVAGLQLLVNGNAVVLDANGMARYTPTTAGTIFAKAIATDTAGNVGQATFDVAVIDTSDVNAPEVSLNLGAIAGSLVTAPIDIRGSISDDGQLDYYKLLVAPVAGGAFREIAFVDNPTAIANGVLGKFDPSLLQNDSYILRLEVADNGGHVSYAEEVVDVAGELKLGNFRLSFTDLTVPVTGIPITLTRTYDTLTSGITDDFGYGWRMEFRDTDLRTSLRPPSEEEQLLGYQSAFKDGTRVYITLPGGKREAFTFRPTVDPIFGLASAIGGVNSTVYKPAFVGDKGVTSTLTVKSARILRKDGTDEYVGLNGGINYNPADVNFGNVYVLTTKEGIVYEIDAATGDLLTVTDTNGNKLTYTDDGIYSSSGKQVTFERDAQGRIASVKDPMGELIRYTYDTNGDLISVKDQEQFETKFVYDGQRSHYLKEIIDPLNRTGAKVEYGDDGRLKKTLNATGNSVEIDYDPANSLQTVKDVLGNPTTYEYDTRGNVVRVVDALGNQTRMVYDDNNNLLQVTDANNLVTKYEYDDKGNLKSRTEQYCGCPTVVPGISYYTYDKFGNMTSLVTPTGASTIMKYDSYGQMLSMKDGKGNLIQSFSYYANGLVRSETDSTGTTVYEYDDLGNLIQTTDPDGSITTMEYYADGKLKRMLQDNGTPNDTSDDEIFTFEYDKLGREKFADYGDGIWVKYNYEGTGGEWTKLEAPTIGKIERKLTADGKLAGWVTADGGTPTFKYDLAGRLWRETDASGNDVTEYEYDAVGRLTTVKDLQTGATATKKYDAGGRTTEEIDALNGFTRYFYDPKNGKLIRTERGKYIKDATGQLIEDPTVQKQVYRYEYNGLQTTVIDPLNRRTTSVMNDYYLPTETIYTNGQREKTSYFYNNNLQEAKDYPTKIVDIGGNDRDFTYDELGRLKTATDLGNGTYQYDYSDNGLELITSPTGETLRYGYDALGNLAKVTYGDGNFEQMTYNTVNNRLETVTLPSGETITYDYDDAGRVRSQTSSTSGSVSFTYTTEGAVKTMTDSTGTTTYRYDSNKRLEGMDYANGSSISYTYDIVGRIKTLTEKGSATATAYTTEYDYDAFGNLSWIKDPANGITTMKYDVVNRLQERTLPNGVKTTYEYDDLDRVKSIVHTNAQGQVLASVTYERQGIGEPSKITREDNSYVLLEYDSALRVKKESYYNAAGQLLNETTYTYDASGKRQVQSTSTGDRTFNYSTGYQLDTVTEAGETENYDYDTNGRLTLIERDGKVLDLNHDTYDRLTSVENETTGETTQYIYDGAGNRVKAVEGTQERRFLVAPAMGGGLQSTDLITDSSGNLISNYIYGGGSSPFMRLDANGNAVYYLADAMGSVIGLTDDSGASSGKFLYDAFGNILSQVGGIDSDSGGDFRFQGQWLESESGLYHFRARDYDPATGLFLSRDLVDIIETQPESFNPYQFVYNNPYIYSDPTGMFSMAELNTTITIQDILQQIRATAMNQAREYITDQARGIVGNLITSALNRLLPFSSEIGFADLAPGGHNGSPGLEFEKYLRRAVCGVLGELYPNALWLGVNLERNGEPLSNGFNCGNLNNLENTKIGGNISSLDFIFKQGEPQDTDKKPPAYVSGDIKISVQAAYDRAKRGNRGKEKQWDAMVGYAKYHQFVPIAVYATFYGGPEGRIKSIKKFGAKNGIILETISILPNISFSKK